MRGMGWHKVYLSLFLLVFSPSFFYVFLSASSMALGILFISIFIVLLSGFKIPCFFDNKYLLLFLVVFMAHFTSMLFSLQGFTIKHLLSFLGMMLLIFSAGVLSLEIRKLNPLQLKFILKSLSIIILLLGVVSLFWRVNALGYGKFVKSIFPFSEPSHYAISVSSLLFTTGMYLSRLGRFFLVLTVTLIAIFSPSLILLIIALSMASLYYISSITKTLVVLGLASTSLFLLLSYTGDITYFINRLNFSQSTQNLTALVYLQGWQDMYSALYISKGFGLGFQNMGVLPPGEYGELIYQLAGKYLNRADGGFVASKLISEFGFFGIILVLAYLYKFSSSLIYLIKYVRLKDFSRTENFEKFPAALVFGHSIIVMFCIEMFGRGYGYFSPGVFLFLMALFLMTSRKYTLNKCF